MADGSGSNPLMSLAFLGLIVCVALVVVFGFTSKNGDSKVAADRPTVSTPR